MHTRSHGQSAVSASSEGEPDSGSSPTTTNNSSLATAVAGLTQLMAQVAGELALLRADRTRAPTATDPKDATFHRQFPNLADASVRKTSEQRFARATRQLADPSLA